MSERGVWSQQDIDELLDAWFDGKGLATIAAMFSCSLDAVETKIWKIVTSYRNEDRYRPGPTRKKRTGVLSRRERQAIDKALKGDGQNVHDERHKKATREHLANVLCRDVADIKLPYRARKGRGLGFA